MTRPFVVGTAGHIDHGKTTLVRALTGVDLDTLPEEKARGITIALGFTRLARPGAVPISFVDVPGHERLVRTMIAGATGLDAVLLCVSAVEGAMPQTREHLAILDLLGIRHGLVVLTMADLVDPELLELALLDVEDLVTGTFLEGAPVIPVSVPPQGQPTGLEALVEALTHLELADRPLDGPMRLPIDRAFVRRGFGTVVTGTLRSGQLADGDEVVILPEGLKARVRGLQVHGEAVARTGAGTRSAVNLAGIEREDINRGQVLCHPGVIEPAHIIDAQVRHLPGAPEVEDGATVRLLAGTAEVLAVLGVLDGEALTPASEHLVQLRTEAPIVVLPGDRFILRRESPLQTLGGGRVLDPWARRVRRRDAAAAADELRALLAGDRSVLLRRAGQEGLSDTRAALLGVTGGVLLGERLLHPDEVRRLSAHLLEAVAEWHRDRPLTAGAPRRDLRRGPLQSLDTPTFDGLVASLLNGGALVAEGPTLRLPSFRITPTPEQQATLDTIEAQVRTAGLEGQPASTMLSLNGDATALLLARGTLTRIADRLVLSVELASLRARVEAWLSAQGRLSTSDFKELSGLTRRTAIPMLEWFDSAGITRREGDDRVAGPRLSI